MFGTLGVQEIAIIFFVALVLFGPKKLPELGKTIGKALTEFRRASNDLKSTFEREMHTLEREGESIQRAAETPAVTNSDPDPYAHWAPPEAESTIQPATTLEATAVEQAKLEPSPFPSTLEPTTLEPATVEPTTLPTTLPITEPITVGASVATGAESREATELAGIEGTIPRNGTPQGNRVAEPVAAETPQHS